MDEINLAVVSDLVDTVGLLLAACVLKLGNRHKKLITCSVVPFSVYTSVLEHLYNKLVLAWSFLESCLANYWHASLGSWGVTSIIYQLAMQHLLLL